MNYEFFFFFFQKGTECGELMFSLSYLPTAERLTVVVVKARNLKFSTNVPGEAFVKVSSYILVLFFRKMVIIVFTSNEIITKIDRLLNTRRRKTPPLPD